MLENAAEVGFYLGRQIREAAGRGARAIPPYLAARRAENRAAAQRTRAQLAAAARADYARRQDALALARATRKLRDNPVTARGDAGKQLIGEMIGGKRIDTKGLYVLLRDLDRPGLISHHALIPLAYPQTKGVTFGKFAQIASDWPELVVRLIERANYDQMMYNLPNATRKEVRFYWQDYIWTCGALAGLGRARYLAKAFNNRMLHGPPELFKAQIEGAVLNARTSNTLGFLDQLNFLTAEVPPPEKQPRDLPEGAELPRWVQNFVEVVDAAVRTRQAGIEHPRLLELGEAIQLQVGPSELLARRMLETESAATNMKTIARLAHEHRRASLYVVDDTESPTAPSTQHSGSTDDSAAAA